MKTNATPSISMEELSLTIVLLLQEILETLKKSHPTDDLYYDNADLKRLFNLSDSSLYRSRKEKVLPFRKIRGKIYYPKAHFNVESGS